MDYEDDLDSELENDEEEYRDPWGQSFDDYLDEYYRTHPQ